MFASRPGGWTGDVPPRQVSKPPNGRRCVVSTSDDSFARRGPEIRTPCGGFGRVSMFDAFDIMAPKSKVRISVDYWNVNSVGAYDTGEKDDDQLYKRHLRR